MSILETGQRYENQETPKSRFTKDLPGSRIDMLFFQVAQRLEGTENPFLYTIQFLVKHQLLHDFKHYNARNNITLHQRPTFTSLGTRMPSVPSTRFLHAEPRRLSISRPVHLRHPQAPGR